MAGGRPGAQVNSHFVQLKHIDKGPGDYWYNECRYCQAAFSNSETASRPARIIGRPRNFNSHLDKCEYYKAAQLQPASPLSAASAPSSAAAAPTLMQTPQSISSGTRAQSARREVRENTEASFRPQARRSWKAPRAGCTEPWPTKKRHFTRNEIKELERALGEMYAANHLSDRFIEDETVLRVFELLCPGITEMIPSRRVMGGKLLKSHAAWCLKKAVEALRIIQQRTGGCVNRLSDVWQNISKDHLLGCQLALFGVLLTYGLPPVSDRHDGLAIAEQLESVLKRAQQEGWDVGAIVTDNAG
ncbi:hypothetical protein JG688_00015347 [Phytophthora aleatoria]|uniref:BED-type domain-containing protein n=1 Tax=Phytophthora aleatoria TaxID=2496075 RepID=A0A8J5MD04_9STRA|nr:hypothetical protein JG688_00015347 [Phytophthora aleatoria]